MKKAIYPLMALVLLATPFAYYQTAQADIYGSPLVGWWTLDSGAATDYASTANSGTLINTPTATTGVLAQALNFVSASSQCVSIPNNAAYNSLTNFSHFAWIKTSASAVELINESLSGQNWGMYMDAGGVFHAFVTITGGGQDNVSGITINDGKWHLVGYTRNNTTTTDTLYVDHTAVSFSDTQSGADSPNTTVYIGCRSGSQFFFQGAIDNVLFYNRVLSANDVAQLYYQGASKYGEVF